MGPSYCIRDSLYCLLSVMFQIYVSILFHNVDIGYGRKVKLASFVRRALHILAVSAMQTLPGSKAMQKLAASITAMNLSEGDMVDGATPDGEETTGALAGRSAGGINSCGGRGDAE